MNTSISRCRPVRLLAVLTGGFALIVSLGVAGAQAAVPGGTWHKAEEVPGTAALNKGGNASNRSVSCGAAGNCVAAGYYLDGSGHFQAFVANETDGVWGEAEKVSGTVALNKGGGAFTNSVSCASAGNCAAGGSYTDSALNGQAFVVNETNGTWGNAEEVAAALNKTGLAEVNSVSCASAGNCAAGGYYASGSRNFLKAFVVTETHGVWGKAKQVAAQDEDGEASTDSVSCPSAGNCVAGGNYGNPSGGHAFIIDEVNGVWGTTEVVPGRFNTGQVGSVSCASATSCSAGGNYFDSAGHIQVYVVNKS